MTRPHQILHVDDDAELRMIVELSLGLDPGMTVRGAGSEQEAVACLAAEPDFRPTALLVDYWIDGVTGIELVSRLRRRPELAALPILFLTGRAGEKASAEMLAAGATGVLVKPFDPLTLASEVRRHLDR
jgi:two-component system, OmpR family, response regulator